jgi:hypothetical protein
MHEKNGFKMVFKSEPRILMIPVKYNVWSHFSNTKHENGLETTFLTYIVGVFVPLNSVSIG